MCREMSRQKKEALGFRGGQLWEGKYMGETD